MSTKVNFEKKDIAPDSPPTIVIFVGSSILILLKDCPIAGSKTLSAEYDIKYLSESFLSYECVEKINK